SHAIDMRVPPWLVLIEHTTGHRQVTAACSPKSSGCRVPVCRLVSAPEVLDSCGKHLGSSRLSAGSWLRESTGWSTTREGGAGERGVLSAQRGAGGAHRAAACGVEHVAARAQGGDGVLAGPRSRRLLRHCDRIHLEQDPG